MKTKQLGNSDLHITPVGFGAWAIGGSGWEFAWGGQDDSDSIAAIHEALDAGVNWIDTAAVYGLGHSEEVVARALAGMSNRPYVFTKCSMIWDEKRQIGHSLKAESIRRECEASLRRLKVDAIDLYQIHWPDPEDEIEEGWATMAKLKEEGKVRHIGVSNFDVGQMRAGTRHRPDHVAAATLLTDPPRSGRGDPALCGPARNRRDRLFPDGLGAVDRRHDEGAHRAASHRRLAAEPPRFPGAAPVAQPAAGETAQGHRRPSWPHAGRGRGRLGPPKSGRDRGDRRSPVSPVSLRAFWVQPGFN